MRPAIAAKALRCGSARRIARPARMLVASDSHLRELAFFSSSRSRVLTTSVLPRSESHRRAMSTAAGVGKGTPVTMPALSPTMAHGKIARWNKKEGEAVNSGDVLCEIETDKATVDFTFQDDMVLAKILLPEGSEGVAVGTVMAVMADSPADVVGIQAAVAAGVGSAASSATTAATPPAGSASGPGSAAVSSAHSAPAGAASAGASAADAVASLPASSVMPSARSLMAAAGVAPASVSGTGKGGRITKGDVLAALGRITAGDVAAAAAASNSASAAAQMRGAALVGAAAAPAAASTSDASSAFAAGVAGAALPASLGGWAVGAPPKAPSPSPASLAAIFGALPPRGPVTDVKPSTVRRVIAQRLTASKAGVPHSYASMDIQLDALLRLRAALKAGGVSVSVNDCVIKGAAKALAAVPEANAFYDAALDAVRPSPGIDVSVAVATEGGLITPIVRGADGLGLAAIADRVRELAGRARAGRLKPEEFQGGSFTISNLGMFGSVSSFTAVINPPQACILAVGKGEKRAMGARLTPGELEALYGPLGGASASASASASACASQPYIAEVMTVQLSADARVVEPHIAGQFLQALRHFLQEPLLLSA